MRTDFGALRELCGSTVRLRDRASTDEYNEPTAGAWTTTFPAYWEQAQRTVRNEQGEEVRGESTVYVLPKADGTALPAANTDWQIELPDGSVPGRLVAVNSWRDEDDVVQCLEVIVG